MARPVAIDPKTQALIDAAVTKANNEATKAAGAAAKAADARVRVVIKTAVDKASGEFAQAIDEFKTAGNKDAVKTLTALKKSVVEGIKSAAA